MIGVVEVGIIFGTFAITIALAESEGPWGSLAWLRNKTARFGLFQCVPCISLWTSVGLCMTFQRLDMILIAWGTTVLLDRLINAYLAK